MSKPDYLDQLIDQASAKAGSDYKLANLLDVNRATISQWRSGKRSCPPEDVGLMAGMLGMDAEAWTARALVSKHEGTKKGEMLLKVLGKALVATGAAVVTSGANAHGIIFEAAKTMNTWVVLGFVLCIRGKVRITSFATLKTA